MEQYVPVFYFILYHCTSQNNHYSSIFSFIKEENAVLLYLIVICV